MNAAATMLEPDTIAAARSSPAQSRTAGSRGLLGFGRLEPKLDLTQGNHRVLLAPVGQDLDELADVPAAKQRRALLAAAAETRIAALLRGDLVAATRGFAALALGALAAGVLLGLSVGSGGVFGFALAGFAGVAAAGGLLGLPLGVLLFDNFSSSSTVSFFDMSSSKINGSNVRAGGTSTLRRVGATCQ
jgi:hypothetical protein